MCASVFGLKSAALTSLIFEVISAEDTKVALYIIDNTGKKVIHRKVELSEGKNIFKLDVSSLNRAYYTIQVVTENGLHKTQKEFIH